MAGPNIIPSPLCNSSLGTLVGVGFTLGLSEVGLGMIVGVGVIVGSGGTEGAMVGVGTVVGVTVGSAVGVGVVSNL